MSNDLVVLENELRPLVPQFDEALSGRMPAAQLIRTMMVSVERTPKLLLCTRQSLFNSAMTFAVLALPVDGATGQGYLLPFKGRAQPVIGYKGMNTLGSRAGLTITGEVVREGDEFDYLLGTKAFVHHKPKLGNKGRIIAAWATAEANNRPPIISVMGIDDLMAVKAKAPGASMSDSPWNDPHIGLPAMFAKTAKRRLARSTPLQLQSPEFMMAAAMDEAFEERGQRAYITRDHKVQIEAPSDVIDGETETPNASELVTPKENPILTEAREKAFDGEAVIAPWFAKLNADERRFLKSHLPELRKIAANPEKFLQDEGREAADGGRDVLDAWWNRLTPAWREKLDSYRTNILLPIVDAQGSTI